MGGDEVDITCEIQVRHDASQEMEPKQKFAQKSKTPGQNFLRAFFA